MPRDCALSGKTQSRGKPAPTLVSALSGWVKRGLDLIGEHPALAMFIGAAIALVWGLMGAWLGHVQRRREV
ncbi:hypothetical protein [Pseudomonas sp. H9]|uniref:hypothetical protein n=1 Tax=Pseudomonas sp. H9 TaxID=483968 RepID=UPI0026AA1D52